MEEVYSYTQTPEESRMFTISDIQKICGASPNIIRGIAERANIESFISKDRRNKVVFTFQSMKQIVEIYRHLSNVDEIARKNVNKAEVKTVEELRAEHPLVKDDRFFKLSFFPDVIPNCFKECNYEEV